MFLIRVVAFSIFESPKYLMGKGRDEDAVRVVHEVARRNRRTTNLVVDEPRACEVLGNARDRYGWGDSAEDGESELEAYPGAVRDKALGV